MARSAWYGRLVRRVYDGMVALSLALAGCFTDNGGGVTGPGASTSGATTGDPGVTTGAVGATSEDSSASGSTCAEACGSSEPTMPGETGDATTGGPTTSDPTSETTTGDGRPTFAQGMTYSVGGAYALARGNFDGDGLDDLVVTSQNLLKPVVYVYHGGGVVVDAFDVGAAISVVAPSLGSDNDSDSDIVIGQVGTPAVVSPFTWDAGLMVEPPVELPDSCAAPRQLAYGLINVDGLVDLLVACDTGGLVVLPGVNVGPFGAPLQLGVSGKVVGVALADVTADGKLDALYLDAVSGSVVFIRGAGILNLDANKSTDFKVEMPSAVAVGNFDGDLFVDFVVTSDLGGCATFRGSADAPIVGPVHACGGKAQDVALADIDADGFDDVVTVHSGELHVGYGAGDGTFSASEIIPAGEQPARVAVGDFNGDLKPDLAVTGLDRLTVILQD